MAKKTISEFFNDDGMTQAAALAFYAITSLAPLLLIIVSISGFILPHYSAQIVNWLTSQVGSGAGNSINSLMVNLEQNRGSGIVSLVIGSVALILAATGLMGNVQHALNIMWSIKPEPKNMIKDFFIQQLLSLLLIFVAGMVLIASLIFSAVFIHLAGSFMPLRTIGAYISVTVDTILFAMIFKYLPKASVRWRDIFVGAFMTAVLYEIGKYALGVFFALGSLGSAYTAAGSFLALMIWLYYSSIIFLVGAKFTHVYASTHGAGVKPAQNAGFTKTKQWPEK